MKRDFIKIHTSNTKNCMKLVEVSFSFHTKFSNFTLKVVVEGGSGCIPTSHICKNYY